MLPHTSPTLCLVHSSLSVARSARFKIRLRPKTCLLCDVRATSCRKKKLNCLSSWNFLCDSGNVCHSICNCCPRSPSPYFIHFLFRAFTKCTCFCFVLCTPCTTRTEFLSLSHDVSFKQREHPSHSTVSTEATHNEKCAAGSFPSHADLQLQHLAPNQAPESLDY